MKSNILLSHKFRIWGWLILIPSVLLGILNFFFGFESAILNTKVFCIHSSFIFQPTYKFSFINKNITNEIYVILIIFGLIFVTFSKEKIEDEYYNSIRLKLLLIATYLNYSFLIFGIAFFYGMSFLNVVVYNMFSLLFFFIIIYNCKKLLLKRSIKNEE